MGAECDEHVTHPPLMRIFHERRHPLQGIRNQRGGFVIRAWRGRRWPCCLATTLDRSAQRSPVERGGQEQSPVPGNAENPVKYGASASQDGRSGTRIRHENPKNNAIPARDDAHSDAPPAEADANPAESTALLARLADCWRRLDAAGQAEVVALAEVLAGPFDDVGGSAPNCAPSAGRA
jgi:hypothetical protein